MKTKTPKQISSEDRSKTSKTKSSKRHRARRRVSSPLPYSSDSDGPRARKKSRRHEPKKAERRRKHPRKPHRKRTRHGNVSSSSSSSSRSSSRSCSTCRGRSRSGSLERSRSPLPRRDRRPGGKGREKERGRGQSRRRRQRLRSCSTCGGSRSRSRSRSYSKEKLKEEINWRTQSRQAADDGEDEGRDKIIPAYDDFPPSRKSKDMKQGRSLDASHQPLEKKAEGSLAVIASAEDGKVVSEKTEGKCAVNAESSTMDLTGEKSKIVDGASNLEAGDLELVLRQKALENFRKFRGGLSAMKKSNADKNDEAVLNQLSNNFGVMKTKGAELLDHGCANTLQSQRRNQEEGRRSGPPRMRSVVSIPTEREFENDTIISPAKALINLAPNSDATEASSPHKRLQGATEGITFSRNVEAKQAVGKTAAAKQTEGLASDASPSINASNNNEFEAADMAGSQYKQKTLSRMHDGEMVHVSYKVYIPKKSPAMARRQLQR